MATSKSVITDAELSLLKVLWAESPLIARDIAKRLYEKATTSSMGTVQKLITRLEEKGMLHRDATRWPHRFTSALGPAEIAGMQLDEFARKLSGGSLSPFVTHLVLGKGLTQAEKEEVRRLLDRESSPE